jgi:hypothetical protein
VWAFSQRCKECTHNNRDHVWHLLWCECVLFWFVGLWACQLHCRSENTVITKSLCLSIGLTKLFVVGCQIISTFMCNCSSKYIIYKVIIVHVWRKQSWYENKEETLKLCIMLLLVKIISSSRYYQLIKWEAQYAFEVGLFTTSARFGNSTPGFHWDPLLYAQCWGNSGLFKVRFSQQQIWRLVSLECDYMYQCVRGICCLHLLGRRRFLQNVGTFLTGYTISHTREQ